MTKPYTSESHSPINLRASFQDWGYDPSPNAWTPPTDVYETAQDIIVRVEIAGVNIDDFDIDFSKGILAIRGNRADASARKAFHRMEIRYGNFQVNVKISIPVNAGAITAEYRDGLLFIQLPKAETKRIVINND